MLSNFNAKVPCDVTVDTRELCESRDSCSDLIFSRKELEVFIAMLCIYHYTYDQHSHILTLSTGIYSPALDFV